MGSRPSLSSLKERLEDTVERFSSDSEFALVVCALEDLGVIELYHERSIASAREYFARALKLADDAKEYLKSAEILFHLYECALVERDHEDAHGILMMIYARTREAPRYRELYAGRLETRATELRGDLAAIGGDSESARQCYQSVLDCGFLPSGEAESLLRKQKSLSR